MRNNFTLIILASLLSISVSWGQAAASGTGLTGVITVRPAHGGPVLVDEPDSPLSGCEFTVHGQNGAVTSFATDADGRFLISLSPGHYSIAIKERRGRHCGPFEVDIAAGKMTTVQWLCDSGLR